MKKYKNRQSGEEVSGRLDYIPYPDTGGHDVYLNHYYYEFYISCFKQILYKNIESFNHEWIEVKNDKAK